MINPKNKQIAKLLIEYLILEEFGKLGNLASMKDRSALRYEKYLDREAKDFLQKFKMLATDVQEIIDRKEPLTPYKALNSQADINNLMKVFRQGLLMDTNHIIKQSIKLGIYHEIKALQQIMPSKYRIKEEIEPKISFSPQNMVVYQNTLDYLKNNPLAGETLSDNVWKTTDNIRRRINKSIYTGTVEGKNAFRIKQDIRTYLTYKGKVGRGVYKSEYKNYMRLVRTEGRTAYNQGYRQYIKSKNWIEGVEIKRRNLTPCNICDPLAGRYYFKTSSPPTPPFHPHCMCYQISIINTDIFEK